MSIRRSTYNMHKFSSVVIQSRCKQKKKKCFSGLASLGTKEKLIECEKNSIT